MTDYSEYSESDFKRAFEQCYKTLTENKLPSDNPRAYILGGQSGAGKSTAHKNCNPRLGAKVAEDKFRKRGRSVDNPPGTLPDKPKRHKR